MDKYLNKDYKKAIESFTVCQGIAKDSGNPYFYINLQLVNGYEKRLFLNDDSKFAFANAFDVCDISEQVDLGSA